MKNNNGKTTISVGWISIFALIAVFVLCLWYAISGTTKWLVVLSIIVATIIGLVILICSCVTIGALVGRKKRSKIASSIQYLEMTQLIDNVKNMGWELEQVNLGSDENPSLKVNGFGVSNGDVEIVFFKCDNPAAQDVWVNGYQDVCSKHLNGAYKNRTASCGNLVYWISETKNEYAATYKIGAVTLCAMAITIDGKSKTKTFLVDCGLPIE